MSNTNTYLARQTNLHRDTIGKIIANKKPVLYRNLVTLFSFLKLLLLDADYESQSLASHRRRVSEPSYEDIVSKVDHTKTEESIKQKEEFVKVLQELDYTHQISIFKTVIEDAQPAAAFFIYGNPDHGQRWLTNLLSYKVPNYSNAWSKPIHIKRSRKHISDIWVMLAAILKTDPLPKELINQIYQHWQTQTVILAIHDIHLVAENDLKQFMGELWEPLAKMVRQNQEQSRHRLLLFLIDNYNSELKASLSFVTEPDKDKPHILLALKKLEPFNQNLLNSWVEVDSHHKILSKLSKNKEYIREIMCDILKHGNQPVYVFKCICDEFDFEWYEIERELAL